MIEMCFGYPEKQLLCKPHKSIHTSAISMNGNIGYLRLPFPLYILSVSKISSQTLLKTILPRYIQQIKLYLEIHPIDTFVLNPWDTTINFLNQLWNFITLGLANYNKYLKQLSFATFGDSTFCVSPHFGFLVGGG